MGFAILDASREPPVVIDRGLIPTPKLGTTAERLVAIGDAIDGLIAAHRPADLVLERLYFNKNVKTAMLVAEARGIALLCGARAGLKVSEYTPQEVKLSVTGSGSADKGQVQRMLHLVLRLEGPITQDNVADAVAIALTHAQRVRFAAAVSRAQ
jgi:crossover junction endodeoxyribonuclease RuvC